ncbi:hypothetical protein B0H19DRAFT_1136062 [Mycena capillaripes]|nr:hypothetical protein B0H19DRAFT_1136062 [Mycena capillaripes]
MLLSFLLLHFVYIQSSQVQGYTLDSRTAADNTSSRGLFTIIWGCLTTIFASTWVSVHPNVPPTDKSWLALFWRRLWMMLIAVIAPEVIVGFAARQFYSARTSSKEYGVSLTHAFFFEMGGFVSQSGQPIATSKQLDDPLLGPKYLSAIKKVKVEDIWDKSKGDALSKGVALAQGLWFTTQCLARIYQNLPVTELEVATLAFAVVNILIWMLWWGKPYNVQQPIPIGPDEGSELPGSTLSLLQLQQAANIGHSNLWERYRFFGAFVGIYRYNPKFSTSVPAFWSRIDVKASTHSVTIQCFVGILFGAIHCAAWNSQFPSADEMWMWRICSLCVALIPLLLLRIFQAGYVFDSVSVFNIALVSIIPIYIVARIFLVVLPFMALRSLPPGALVDVDWTSYIPHL